MKMLFDMFFFFVAHIKFFLIIVSAIASFFYGHYLYQTQLSQAKLFAPTLSQNIGCFHRFLGTHKLHHMPV